MNRRTLVALSIGLTLAVSACHKKDPPGVTPTPTGSGSTTPTGGGTLPPPPPTQPPPPPVNVDLDKAAAGRVATMGDMIHFDYNEAAIRPDDNARLDMKASMMKQFTALRIRITGHADERGSDQYNIALGKRRAEVAKDYLVRAGIDASRIETASLGREVPIALGHDEASWAQNRRDQFDIIAGTQSLRVP